MARICVELPDEIEKQLRLKTIERSAGKKATVPEPSKKRVSPRPRHLQIAPF
jgi:hypothetical protein